MSLWVPGMLLRIHRIQVDTNLLRATASLRIPLPLVAMFLNMRDLQDAFCQSSSRSLSFLQLFINIY